MTDKFQIQHYTFDEIIEQFKRSGDVLGILAMGSTGQPSMKPYSDYDLAIILGEGVPALYTASIWIENQLGDLYFFQHEEIEDLLDYRKVDADTTLHKLLDWVHTSKVLFDKDKLIKQLQEVDQKKLEVRNASGKAYSAWFGVNFNYAHNKRYFNSGDELYLQALEIRLLYCSIDLLTAYYALRDLRWEGEKAAIKYLKVEDPDFLALFQHMLRQSELEKKFHDYSLLVERLLDGFGGVWAEDECAVTMNNASVEEGLEWLHTLFSEPRYQK